MNSMLDPSAGISTDPTEPVVQLVTFTLGDECFALDILKVQEIIRHAAVTPVPHTPAFVEGVITLRGKIVPVIDLRSRFGLEAAPHSVTTRIIVINQGQIPLGLVVDRVEEVTCVGQSRIEPMAAAAGDSTGDYVTGVGKLDGRLVTLVDADILATPLAEALKAA